MIKMMRNGDKIKPLDIPLKYHSVPSVQYVDESDINAEPVED